MTQLIKKEEIYLEHTQVKLSDCDKDILPRTLVRGRHEYIWKRRKLFK